MEKTRKTKEMITYRDNKEESGKPNNKLVGKVNNKWQVPGTN